MAIQTRPGRPGIALPACRFALGQRIESFTIDAWLGTGWQEVARGTTVGHKRLLRFGDTITDRVRLTVLGSRGAPRVSEFGLFRAPAEYRGRMDLKLPHNNQE